MVEFLSDHSIRAAFESDYIKVRQREGRVLDDEAIRALPFAAPFPEHRREWTWRKKTFLRFKKYVDKKFGNRPHRILDLGCGNGWFSARLTQGNPEREVWGVDVNLTELEQADRVFGGPKLRFVYGDVREGVLPENYFDCVVLAASVQYFPDLNVLTDSCQKCLKEGGEIHILDSPFYKDESARRAARQRTAEYYGNLGIEQMSAHYFHHLKAEIGALGFRVVDGDLLSRVKRRLKIRGPFEWFFRRFY